jgi:hypothetical protein
MKQLIIVLLLHTVVCAAIAQIPNGQELTELVRIHNAYELRPSIGFTMEVTVADSANPVNKKIRIGQYKIQNRQQWLGMDSTETISNPYLEITVDYTERMIMTQKPDVQDDLLKIGIMDRRFREAFVDSIKHQSVSDTSSRLTIYCKAESNYSHFSIQYHPFTYLLQKLDFFQQKGYQNESDNGSPVTARVTVSFNSYTYQTFPDSLFIVSRFVLWDGQRYQKQPAFSAYNLIDEFIQ